jgi:enoyl-CoA hydratase
MIEQEMRGPVAVLRLAHGKVSALDAELLEALVGALDAVERSPARAVLLTGSGTSFSAGVDLFRILDGGADYVRRFLPLLDAGLRRLFLFPRPVVAAVNGHAIAGGCLLALACDRSILAAGRARVGVPELLVGVPFPALALEILRFACGDRRGQDLAGGRTLLPDAALAQGIVDEVVPESELLERATTAASHLGAIPPAAFAIVKRQLRLPAVLRADRFERDLGPEVLRAWCAPETHAVIRGYLERTLGKT